PACLTLALDPSTLHGKNGTVTTLANGSKTISFSGVKNSTDPDIAQDESFSNRAVPTFVNSTGSSVTLANGGNVIIDTTATMQTLLKTINNPQGTNTGNRFHGFNFLNYDLRGYSSLNGATGADPSAVQVFIVFDTVTPFTAPAASGGGKTFINPTTGAVDA